MVEVGSGGPDRIVRAGAEGFVQSQRAGMPWLVDLERGGQMVGSQTPAVSILGWYGLWCGG